MTADELHNHLSRIGSRGGNASTEKQHSTRRLNAYRTLALRYPNSVKVRQQLAKLEKMEKEADRESHT